jgi:dolichol kinase
VAVPLLARRSRLAARIHGALAGGDERWDGVALYTVAFAAFTLSGLRGAPLAAGGALLALCLGDGLGGAVGRRFGRVRFRVPGGKRKSLEGSLTVAAGAVLGALVAGWRFGAPVDVGSALAVGGIAAVAEGLSPRGSDNLLLPAAAWAGLTFLVGGGP